MIVGIRDAGIAFGSSSPGTNKLSDHGRGPIQLDYNRIENSIRMSDGTLRKQVIATKCNYSVSWTLIPSLTSKTVDAYWGGDAMRDFYNATNGSFYSTFTIDTGGGTNNTTETKLVMFTDFSYEIANRSQAGFDLVNISMSFEEV